MIGLFILKHTYALSDEGIWERWVNDPYFQCFTGEEFFRHQLPHERSGMTHWHNRIGETLDILLQESLRIAHDSGALKKSDLARVTVDTTTTHVAAQEHHLPDRRQAASGGDPAIGQAGQGAQCAHGQSYGRVAKTAAMMAGRYAHAKQYRRMHRRTKFLRTRLARVIRDIRCKTKGNDELRTLFAVPLIKAI